MIIKSLCSFSLKKHKNLCPFKLKNRINYVVLTYVCTSNFFLGQWAFKEKGFTCLFPTIYSVSLIINIFLRNSAKLNFFNYKLKPDSQLLKLYSKYLKTITTHLQCISRQSQNSVDTATWTYVWYLAIAILWYFRSQKRNKMQQLSERDLGEFWFFPHEFTICHTLTGVSRLVQAEVRRPAKCCNVWASTPSPKDVGTKKSWHYLNVNGQICREHFPAHLWGEVRHGKFCTHAE